MAVDFGDFHAAKEEADVLLDRHPEAGSASLRYPQRTDPLRSHAYFGKWLNVDHMSGQ
jgi:hypothetical protein